MLVVLVALWEMCAHVQVEEKTSNGSIIVPAGLFTGLLAHLADAFARRVFVRALRTRPWPCGLAPPPFVRGGLPTGLFDGLP